MIPKVTVVIPFYNCPYVAIAVQSALFQTYPDVEIIAVSDGSTQYEEKLAPYEDRIRIIRKTNGGTASALNAGFQAATGEYIAWLSSDDVHQPNKIAKQLNFMRYFHAEISYTNFDYIDETGSVTKPSASLVFPNFLELYRMMLERDPVNGSTVMMRRSAYERIGPFDESLPYTHDYDYWLRVIVSGMPLFYLHDSLTLYRWHERMGTVRFRPAVEQEMEQTKARHRERLLAFLASL